MLCLLIDRGKLVSQINSASSLEYVSIKAPLFMKISFNKVLLLPFAMNIFLAFIPLIKSTLFYYFFKDLLAFPIFYNLFYFLTELRLFCSVLTW